ncbi:unnamed protein product [Staurois parvus]|uniref:Uncharacterized protein n=1 Tax=Staurois parvus TaxID=386267 RepID=A0ABN9D4Z7_9NEOB|nr:unnamed protein product [Staurois parvus]
MVQGYSPLYHVTSCHQSQLSQYFSAAERIQPEEK